MTWSVPDRFIMSILRGRCGMVNIHPVFKLNKLKSFSRREIDENHVDKRILGGKGFAVGRLNKHSITFVRPAFWRPNL